VSYASTADLSAFLTANGMGAAPANAQLLLDRASRLVRSATMTAVYDTDTDGNATDPAVLAALKNATLEHVAVLITMGSDGAPTGYQSFSAGRISLGRDQSSGAGNIADGSTLAPQAYLELQAAGLTSQEAWLT
jgi:hypothetical protein